VKKIQPQGVFAKEIANLIINKRIKADTVDEFVELVLVSKEKAQLPKKEEERLILEAIEKNPSAVDDFKKGKKTALEFLVGQVARLSQGKADANKIRDILKNRLETS
jgi:aspartyl-tRNA(Asn)/glutamyl-tRNA(Gln) amidotransferase subunit B